MRLFLITVFACMFAHAALAETDLSVQVSKAAESIALASAKFEAASGSDDMVLTLGEVIMAFENGLRVLRENLRVLSLRERELDEEYRQKSGNFSQLLGTLYAVESQPSPLLFLHPGGALAAAEAAQLLAQATPVMQAKAQQIGFQVEELAGLRRQRESALTNLRTGLAGLLNARAALDDAIAKGDPVPALFVDDRMQVQILSATAQSLSDFAAALAALPLPNTGLKPILGAEVVPWPVAGRILVGFNQTDKSGVRRPGIVAEAAPLALVASPFDATIRFAGPFQDYGNVVILEPQAGTLLILAGIKRLFRAEGDVLAKGDPIGQLGGSETTDEEFLIEASSETGVQVAQTLYIELRKDGESVDPTPWFQKD